MKELHQAPSSLTHMTTERVIEMGVSLTNVKFHVEDNSWGDLRRKKVHGMIKVNAWVEVGSVLTESLDFYKEMEFVASKLPEEIQEKLIDVYEDIQKFLDANHKFKLKDI